MTQHVQETLHAKQIQKAKEEGEHQKAVEIAKVGLENNILLETISLMTGLSIPELKEIKMED